MFKEIILDKLAYNLWANARTVESLKETKSEKAFSLMGHIVDAQTTWLVRVKDPSSASKNFWNTYSVEEMAFHHEKSNKDWEEFISSLDEKDFSRMIDYTNSQGKSYQNTIGEIITHVLNHSTYHRGQIAAEVRKSGAPPALTDYIAYKRKL